MKAFNLAAHPDGLAVPLRPLKGLAYPFPTLAALTGFWRLADLTPPLTWHRRNTLKGIVRGLPLCLTLTLQRGFTPNRYPARRLTYGN
jgi:hypothetical protein